MPQLESLRYLEASIRLGSFTRAANELGVTPAAVSLRIRWQGVRLYLRGLPVIPRPAHQSQEGVQ